MEKILLEVDWENPSDLKNTITKLQKRRKSILRILGYDEIYFNNSKHHLSLLLPSFEKMIEGVVDDTGVYYVYAHCNPLKPLNIKHDIKHLFLSSKFSPQLEYEPFYIGKGTDNKYLNLNLNRNGSHSKIRSGLKKFDKEIECVILRKNLSADNALLLESKLIDILGLRSLSHHGLLCNLDEGVDNNQRRLLYDDPTITKILKRNGFRFKE